MAQECDVDVLKLEHDAPEEFRECIFQTEPGTSTLYVIYMRFLELYYFAMILADLILIFIDIHYKFLIYIDIWTLNFLSMSARFSDVNVGGAWYYKGYQDDEYYDHMPWNFKVYWALFSAELPATLFSAIVFWTQVYKNKSHIFLIVLNIVSPLLVICNFLLIAFPLRLLHFIYFVIFYIVYILFTLIYQKAGGTGVDGSIPIYKVLDWRRPGKAALAAFVGLAIGVGLYVLFCFISMGKLWLRWRQHHHHHHHPNLPHMPDR